MEPFGLLNFLQTALSLGDFSQNTAQTNSENKGNPPPAPSTEKNNFSAEEIEKSAPPAAQNFGAQNAFTQFMSAHDARVKKTRK